MVNSGECSIEILTPKRNKLNKLYLNRTIKRHSHSNETDQSWSSETTTQRAEIPARAVRYNSVHKIDTYTCGNPTQLVQYHTLH